MAAMYSPVSHIAVDGAMVMKYKRKTAAAAIAAALYDGSYPAPESAAARAAAGLAGVDREAAAVIARSMRARELT